MNRHLTTFQQTTSRQLGAHASRHGIALPPPAQAGEHEQYLYYTVRGVQLWIYSDGACIIGPGVEHVFEKCDYDTADALRDAFVAEALKTLQ